MPRPVTPPPGGGWRFMPLFADCPKCGAQSFHPCRSLRGHARHPHRRRQAWVKIEEAPRAEPLFPVFDALMGPFDLFWNAIRAFPVLDEPAITDPGLCL